MLYLLGYMFLNYLIHKASRFVCFPPSHNFPNLLPPLHSEGLVLRCPSSCNESNSLMLMVCLSLGPCWDHQPTSRGRCLAPGRGRPRAGETEEKKRERGAKEGSGLMHVGSSLRQIGLLRQKGPVDKRGCH